MQRITYMPDQREVEAETSETILHASLRAGIPHTHACGGKARCSTCRVVIEEGLEHCCSRNAKEQRLADRLHFASEIRLACQTTVSGDVRLRRVVWDAVDEALTSQLRRGVATAPIGVRVSRLWITTRRGFRKLKKKSTPDPHPRKSLLLPPMFQKKRTSNVM